MGHNGTAARLTVIGSCLRGGEVHPLADRFVKVAVAVVLRLQITDWRPLPNSAGSAAAAVSDRPPPQHPPGRFTRASQSSGARWTSLSLSIASCISYDVIIAGDGARIP